MSENTTIGEQSELCAQRKAAVRDAELAIQTAADALGQVTEQAREAEAAFAQALTDLQAMVADLADPGTPVERTHTALAAKLNAAAHPVLVETPLVVNTPPPPVVEIQPTEEVAPPEQPPLVEVTPDPSS